MLVTKNWGKQTCLPFFAMGKWASGGNRATYQNLFPRKRFCRHRRRPSV